MKTRWYTIIEVVHRDTGEILPSKELERNRYRIIETEQKYEYKDGYSIRKIRKIVREHEQTRLEI